MAVKFLPEGEKFLDEETGIYLWEKDARPQDSLYFFILQDGDKKYEIDTISSTVAPDVYDPDFIHSTYYVTKITPQVEDPNKLKTYEATLAKTLQAYRKHHDLLPGSNWVFSVEFGKLHLSNQGSN